MKRRDILCDLGGASLPRFMETSFVLNSHENVANEEHRRGTADAVSLSLLRLPNPAKTELHEIMSTFASQESRRCFAVLVLANKQDLDKAMTPAQLERALGIGNRYAAVARLRR